MKLKFDMLTNFEPLSSKRRHIHVFYLLGLLADENTDIMSNFMIEVRK